MEDKIENSFYFKENLILGDPASEAGLVTLWTMTDKIVSKLDKALFKIAGQLYSKEGINYILRNILADPTLHYLIVCGQDLSGSGKALIDFFERGIDKDYNIIGNDFSKIHSQVPREAIDLLRAKVKIKNLIGVTDEGKITQALESCLKIGKPFAKPQTFADNKKEGLNALPSEGTVFEVRDDFIGPAWLKILKLIFRFGRVNKTWYGNEVREIFNIAAVIRKENPFEPKMLPFMPISLADIENYQKSIMRAEKGDEVYTYGERLWGYKGINQVEEVIIPFLKKYPNDRAALAVTFDMAHDHKAPRSPCMCLFQATGAGDKINATAYFRSHAIFSGWIINAFGLRRVQAHIAKSFGKELGSLTIFSNCAHIYDNEWQACEDILEKYGAKEPGFDSDPRGYFVISLEGEEIKAKLFSPEGAFLEEFSQNGREEKAAVKLYNKVLNKDAVSLISHAFDLGAEFQKAEIAIKFGKKYVQDKPLE